MSAVGWKWRDQIRYGEHTHLRCFLARFPLDVVVMISCHDNVFLRIYIQDIDEFPSSRHKEPVMQIFDVFFVVGLNKLLNPLIYRWFKTQRRQDKVAAILQMAYPNLCSCMRIIIFLWLIHFDPNITLVFVPKGRIIWTKHQSARLAAGTDSNVLI